MGETSIMGEPYLYCPMCYYGSHQLKRNVPVHYGPSTGDFSPLTGLHPSTLLFDKTLHAAQLKWPFISFITDITHTADRCL